MRKQLLTIFGVAALGMASYAATFMQVKTKDGEIVKFDVNDVDEVFFEDVASPVDTTPSSNHEYVDLGLPSGTLWATYNVGATKPEEYGDYFAWGETEPKDVYDWSTYKWGDDEMTKYNDGDGLMTLLPEDDAATANWGSEWRMPTNEEQRELVEECQYQMTEVNGVYGAKFTGKNGNSVFFPAVGRRYGSDVLGKGNYGCYWSSSLVEKRENDARSLNFSNEYVGWRYDSYRYDGYSVRAVRVQKAERKMYVVKFYTSDSVLINSQEVLEGASAKEIQAPEKNGYEFIGWSASLDKITSDMSVYALYKEKSPIDTPSSNHSYVDLGLPSGTLWATYNIGATKTEEYGWYFAWGGTEPKDVYDWSTYKYAKASGAYQLDSITKYNMSGRYGIIDSLSTLLPEDDAATANWGSEWRMPTNEEQRELLDECYVVWTDSYNGREVRGIIVYKAKSAEDKGEFVGSWQTPSEDYSTSDSHVFFPAAGYRYGSDVFDVGDSGNVWSSSLDEKYEDLARYLSFNEEYADWYGNDYRINGFPVRAVRAQK